MSTPPVYAAVRFSVLFCLSGTGYHVVYDGGTVSGGRYNASPNSFRLVLDQQLCFGSAFEVVLLGTLVCYQSTQRQRELKYARHPPARLLLTFADSLFFLLLAGRIVSGRRGRCSICWAQS